MEEGFIIGLAHCACSIFANNCYDGFLTSTWANDEHGGERVMAEWDDILPEAELVQFQQDINSNMTNRLLNSPRVQKLRMRRQIGGCLVQVSQKCPRRELLLSVDTI